MEMIFLVVCLTVITVWALSSFGHGIIPDDEEYIE
jgi:hypothetical protein